MSHSPWVGGDSCLARCVHDIKLKRQAIYNCLVFCAWFFCICFVAFVRVCICFENSLYRVLRGCARVRRVRVYSCLFASSAALFFFHSLALPFPSHLAFFLPAAGASFHCLGEFWALYKALVVYR